MRSSPAAEISTQLGCRRVAETAAGGKNPRRTPTKNLGEEPGAENSGGDSFFLVARLAQDIAAPPDRLNVIAAIARIGKFLAQLADENVDDLQFRLVHPAVEMVE